MVVAGPIEVTGPVRLTAPEALTAVVDMVPSPQRMPRPVPGAPCANVIDEESARENWALPVPVNVPLDAVIPFVNVPELPVKPPGTVKFPALVKVE